jgi:hypothetical protein
LGGICGDGRWWAAVWGVAVNKIVREKNEGKSERGWGLRGRVHVVGGLAGANPVGLS